MQVKKKKNLQKKTPAKTNKATDGGDLFLSRILRLSKPSPWNKNKVKSDLESFLKGKQYYHHLGCVWRCNFLLYSPSGTGKSSFMAAMANFLSYDVYNIDVSKVSKDSDLNSLLLETTSRSIIVIEDFDRFLMEKPRTENLLVIMKFMDGILKSCIAKERLMVFTMNSKEHLLIDPTVLRPGRIDVHIHFPLCDFSGFKSLYLSTQNYTITITTCFQGRLNWDFWEF